MMNVPSSPTRTNSVSNSNVSMNGARSVESKTMVWLNESGTTYFAPVSVTAWRLSRFASRCDSTMPPPEALPDISRWRNPFPEKNSPVQGFVPSNMNGTLIVSVVPAAAPAASASAAATSTTRERTRNARVHNELLQRNWPIPTLIVALLSVLALVAAPVVAVAAELRPEAAERDVLEPERGSRRGDDRRRGERLIAVVVDGEGI